MAAAEVEEEEVWEETLLDLRAHSGYPPALQAVEKLHPFPMYSSECSEIPLQSLCIALCRSELFPLLQLAQRLCTSETALPLPLPLLLLLLLEEEEEK